MESMQWKLEELAAALIVFGQNWRRGPGVCVYQGSEESCQAQFNCSKRFGRSTNSFIVWRIVIIAYLMALSGVNFRFDVKYFYGPNWYR